MPTGLEDRDGRCWSLAQQFRVEIATFGGREWIKHQGPHAHLEPTLCAVEQKAGHVADLGDVPDDIGGAHAGRIGSSVAIWKA